jgi:hypothetical protein
MQKPKIKLNALAYTEVKNAFKSVVIFNGWTASVVLATVSEVLCSIPSTTRFSEK